MSDEDHLIPFRNEGKKLTVEFESLCMTFACDESDWYAEKQIGTAPFTGTRTLYAHFHNTGSRKRVANSEMNLI
jgi:hypothetical protein